MFDEQVCVDGMLKVLLLIVFDLVDLIFEDVNESWWCEETSVMDEKNFDRFVDMGLLFDVIQSSIFIVEIVS